MNAAIFGVLALLSFSGVAHGQTEYVTPLNDAQKRRVHLPYIRAATDCIANAMRFNVAALDHAVAGRWGEGVGVVWNTCRDQLVQVIVQHDSLYGQGTGLPFVQGPYIADLPRALSTRLKDELVRHTAFQRAEAERQAEVARQQREELARKEAERAHELAVAKKAAEVLKEEMFKCTTGQLRKLVSSSETADVLASAVITICNNEVLSAVRAATAVLSRELPGSSADTLRSELSAAVRKEVVANAVQVRALNAAPQTSKPTTSPAASELSFAGTEECLRSASKARDGKLVSQNALLSAMVDMCRPEIEAAGRALFLKDNSRPLAEAREKALEAALRQARTIVGVPD